MATQPETAARTRAFARVIGPFLMIVPAIIALRAPNMDVLASAFFEQPLWPWFAGAMLLFGGLFIIAHHQYWSSVPAVLISLFGWFLALRGLVLLLAPEWIERAVAAATFSTLLVRIGFAILVLIGIRLTWAGWIARAPLPPNGSAR
jgi:hypothetical protein